MNKAELQELAEDIKTNGLRTGITIWGKKPEQPSKRLPILLDGRNRLDAIAQAGMLAVNNQGHLCIRTSDDTGQGLRLIKYNYREGDPHKLSRSLNVYRRHLSIEWRRRLVAGALMTDPTKSDRTISEEAGVDHKTVAVVRADMEGRGEITHVETRTDSIGRQQPATKPGIGSDELIDPARVTAFRRSLPQPLALIDDATAAEDEAADTVLDRMMQDFQQLPSQRQRDRCIRRLMAAYSGGR